MGTLPFFLAALVFWPFALQWLLTMPWAQRLPPLRGPAKRPKVSVIIPARDEEEGIESTVQYALAQEGVEVEVIVADDRSQDGTGEVLRRIMARNARVRTVRIDALPEGWLGKCHACHLAAQQATGEWLLFTDADCRLTPDVLARALDVARTESVQHIALTPGVAPQTIWAAAWHLTFLLTLADWFARVNQDKPKGHFGMGAFNLVEAETYRAFGGYERLRLSVVDDLKLGLLVRLCGKRTRAFIGGGDTECHWGVTVPHMLKVMEKNYFAASDYNVAAGIVVGVVLPLLWLAAILGPFSGTVLGWAAGASLVATVPPSAMLARRLAWNRALSLLVPLMFPVLYYAILRSMTLTLWRGGIRWRETFYPLPMLRAGNVR